MNAVRFFTDWPLTEQIGWALLHSLWQLLLAALLLKLALLLIPTRQSRVRYAIACAALGLAAALPVFTVLRQQAGPQNTTTIEVVSAAQRPSSLVSAEPAARGVRPTGPPADRASAPHRAGGFLSTSDRWRSAMVPLLPWIVGGWFCGVILFSFRPLAGWAHAWRLRHNGCSHVPGVITRRVQVLAAQMGVVRTVQVVQSTLVAVPTVVGLLRPLILLPASSLTGLSAHELQCILLHELAHIRRRDLLVNLAQTIVETAFFYHPAMWWLSAQVRRERESCCDDMAVEAGSDPAVLVQALLRLDQRPPAAATVAASGGALLRRVHRLLGTASPTADRHDRARVLAAILFVAMAFAAVTGFYRVLRASEQQSSFDTVIITFYDNSLPWSELSSDDPRQVAALLELFPQAGQGRNGMTPAGWDADFQLAFHRLDQRGPRISVSLRQHLWSEGLGDWPLRDAADWNKIFSRLAQASAVQQAQHRAANLKTYQDTAEQLRKDFAGKWVVIQNGEIQVCNTFAETVESLQQEVRKPPHRFVFRPGIDDGEERFGLSPWVTGRPNWNQLGRQFQRAQEMTIAAGQWIRGDRSLGTPEGKGRLALAVPGVDAQIITSAVCSGLFPYELTLTEAQASKLGLLQHYAVPGTAQMEGFGGQCQKVCCRVVIDQLGIDTTVIAFVIPDQVVAGDPPQPHQDPYAPLVISAADGARRDGGEPPGGAPPQPGNPAKEEPGRDGSADKQQSKPRRDDDQRTWEVRGTVTTADGQPVRGASINVFTGMGTLRNTGTAQTDERGEYRATFGPGMLLYSEQPGGGHVGVQAATIIVARQGWVERDLCRAGDRLMAETTPEGDTAWGSSKQIRDRLILPGQPATIDFVMIPAASVRGVLRDADGNLLARRSVWLSGSQLPPSSSVLAAGHTDDLGHFELDGVPTGRKWSFAFRVPNSFEEVVSNEVQFDTAEPHQVVLTVDLQSDPKTLRVTEWDDEAQQQQQHLMRELTERKVVLGDTVSEEENRGVSWGKENQGLQASLRLPGGKAQFKVGEQLAIEFLVRNTSDQRITFESSSWRQEDKLHIRHVDGPVVKEIGTNWYSGWPIINQYQLEPGQQVTLQSGEIGIAPVGDPLGAFQHPVVYLPVLDPGKYVLYFRIYLPDINRLQYREGDWHGGLYTQEVEIQVQ